jgi:hypothetical protein
VLIVSTVDPSKIYDGTTVEESLKIERVRTRVAADLILEHGGKIVAGLASPLAGLWQCDEKAPDRRALAAGLAIVGALGNPEVIPPADPLSAHWGVTVGGACGPTIFHRDGEEIISVLGPAVARAEGLHDLAKLRGATLGVDGKLGGLASPVRWVRVGDDAWCLP